MEQTAIPVANRTVGRRERRRTETRERIFRAALKLFARQSFTATTVEEITEAADVGKGTFFNYFPSKEHVLAAFGQMHAGKVAAGLAAVERGEASAREVLRRLPAQLVEEPGRSVELMRSLLVAIHTSAAVRQLLSATLERGQEHLARMIWISQEHGQIRKDRLAIGLARMFQQTVFGALQMWTIHPDTRLEEWLEPAMEIFWAGLNPGLPDQG